MMVKINKPKVYDAEVLTDHEENLILRSIGGDVEAFSELVGMYQDKVIRLAYSFLKDWEEARDVAQEAFVKGYRAIRGFQADASFGTWIYRITVNQCKDHLRKRKIRQHLWGWLKRDADDKESPEMRVPASTGTESEVLHRELKLQLDGAVEKLPIQQRTVFILRYYEDLDLKEIAVTLNISTGAVKAHLWQAGQKIKKEIGHYLS